MAAIAGDGLRGDYVDMSQLPTMLTQVTLCQSEFCEYHAQAEQEYVRLPSNNLPSTNAAARICVLDTHATHCILYI